MVAKSNTQLDYSSQDDGPRIMPDTAHEVSAILLLTMNGRKVPIGNIRDDFDDLANVMVRLGTKVSNGYPSSIGFRVLLRTDVPKNGNSGSIEDNYHLMSCRFDPQYGEISYMRATEEDKQELVDVQHFGKSLKADLTAGIDEDLYRMDFNISDTNGFLISRHGPNMRTSNNEVKKAEKLLPYIAYATKVSLFFIADTLLVEHLDSAIKQDCVGAVPPSWKTALPDSAIRKWPLNVQTQMVAGSIDVYNVLLASLHEKPLRDGPGTLVRERPESTRFSEFVHKTYPNIRQEISRKVYPVMLNVSNDCVCVELPFGGSMLNRGNTYAAINALHKLKAAEIALNHVAIVTLYPTQVGAYQDALSRCHRLNPSSGYDRVQVGLPEAWVNKTVGVAIVDLVRTRNSSGNLGYLSQANRLKVLLTLHRDGLIIVGNRGCTVTSQGTATSTKLDKVLQWFVDNGRIVQMSNKGLPQASENPSFGKVPSTNPEFPNLRQAQPQQSHLSTTDPDFSSTSSTALHGHIASVTNAGTLSSGRKYVGIPGLERWSIENKGLPQASEYPSSEKVPSTNPEVSEIQEPPPQSSQLSTTDPTSSSTSSNASHGHISSMSKASTLNSGRKYVGIPGLEHWSIENPTREIDSFTSSRKSEAQDLETARGTLVGLGLTNTRGASSRPEAEPQGSYTEAGFSDAFNLHKAVPEAKGFHHDNKSEAGLTKDAGSSFADTNVSKKEARIQRPDDLTMEASSHEAHKPKPPGIEVPSKHIDINSRFEALTSRFKTEYGSEKFDKVLKESRNKRSNTANPNAPKTLSASPSELGNPTPRVGMPLESASNENVRPPSIIKGTSHQGLRIEPEPVFSQQNPKGPPSHHSGWTPPEGGDDDVMAVFSRQPFKSQSAEKASNGLDELLIPRSGGTGPSASDLGVGQLAERKPDFTTLYQKKYRTIRKQFASMTGISRDESGEDQLFRRLAEAYLDEDAEGFEEIYIKLLGIAAGLQTRGLRKR